MLVRGTPAFLRGLCKKTDPTGVSTGGRDVLGGMRFVACLYNKFLNGLPSPEVGQVLLVAFPRNIHNNFKVKLLSEGYLHREKGGLRAREGSFRFAPPSSMFLKKREKPFHGFQTNIHLPWVETSLP